MDSFKERKFSILYAFGWIGQNSQLLFEIKWLDIDSTQSVKSDIFSWFWICDSKLTKLTFVSRKTDGTFEYRTFQEGTLMFDNQHAVFKNQDKTYPLTFLNDKQLEEYLKSTY